MFTDEIRGKLENIIRGVSLKEQPDTCTTIRNNLCASYKSDPTAKKDFESKQLIKEEQAKYLKEQALTKNLWIATIPSLQWFQSRSKTRLFEQGVWNQIGRHA